MHTAINANKEFNMLEVSRRIDYLTISHHDTERAFDPLPDDFKIGKKLPPIAHYPLRFALIPAGDIAIADNDKQGVRIRWAGEDCTELYREKLSPVDLMIHCINNSCKTTRLDVAMDVSGSADYMLPVIHWRMGRYAGLARNEPKEYTDQSRKEYTCYFGSPKSDRFVRVYNKAAEAGLLEALTRVEIQTRKERSYALALDIETYGLKTAAANHTKTVINFPQVDWWQYALNAEQVEMMRVSAKNHSYQKWLTGQVAACIRNNAEKTPNDARWLNNWCIEIREEVLHIMQEWGESGEVAHNASDKGE